MTLAACVRHPTTDLSRLPPMPQSAMVADVPFYPQEDQYCGPAAMAMMLSWSGEPIGQEAVAEQVYTPGREGTLRSDMLASARRQGRLAIPVNSVPNLLKELEAGHPVVVFQNRGVPIYPIWHYAVAIGYDLTAGNLTLHSGTKENHTLELGAFEHTWRRGDYWGLVVLPPGDLPASADVWDTLAAAVALERVDDHKAADAAYRSIAMRWPENWAVHFAIGNRRYSEEEYEAAATAYHKAVTRNGNAAEAWNNLAVTLDRLGRRDAAIEAARKAVAVADEAERVGYEKTLAEISGAP